MMNNFSRSLYEQIIKTYSFLDNQVLALFSKEYQTILDIICNYRIINCVHEVAIGAKLIGINNSKIKEEDLINGSKAWRLKKY